MKGWFQFFGVKLHPSFHIDSTESLSPLLRHVPGLAHLQMWFRSPDDGYFTSPWGQSPTRSRPYICCQRVMVDWIMTFVAIRQDGEEGHGWWCSKEGL